MMTAWGAYVNEASLANRYVFKEIMDRCSADEAKIICDTNPDHPQHWLKVDYLDNDKPEVRVSSTHFTLDDNESFLGQKYINDQKAMTPSGMMYERDVLGLWVSGEGMVYQDFDKKRMLVDKVPKDLHYYAGVDWGYEHKGSIVLFGDDDKGNTYLIEEHTKKHKFIDYWVNIAKGIQKRYGYNVTFFIDGARPDNYNEFLRNGINTRNANKARMAGIESVAKLMKLGRFFVLSSAVQSFLDEIYTYIWDDKTGEPVKQNDDVMDAMRYAIYNEHLNNDAQFINSVYI
ncbi:MAG: Terminase [Bacteriophage sp.]|jgi:PBSX family phage terminase large subunit|uniref:PBSX family phage terminase large subunit n=2 Tax=Ligilactobacillus salivarius TaxID=1624 RepID=UPI0013715486|nr:PBSX family phage terminase large subunit [Ligilactobacillus salivarius]MYU70417.1 PBSX family phage terminase large subunit [Ligilactobacillus salivarius]MYZ74928.1 PBSX family phage terminase large subunit [Ligilactobacillus salivarius]UVY23118.1 MAG: Terminase [Bacteriophage sp.]